jgi:DNA-binding GntR family transcriptional regulator
MAPRAKTPSKPQAPADRAVSAVSPADAPPADLTQTIVAAITTAIIEHRLAPGAKLTEQKIAAIYGVSRTIVRQALFQLARDHLVRLEPDRGAFVAQPSVEEAREVFAVRRVLEQHLVEAFCEKAVAGDFRALRAHLKQEQAVVGRVDVTGRTRLLGDFHVLMAERIGNHVLAQILSELISRCALITLMYQSSRAAQHSSDEHVEILKALETRDLARAKSLMEAHLLATENSLLYHRRISSANLAEALGSRAA